jgi:uncharacterized protein YwqG
MFGHRLVIKHSNIMDTYRRDTWIPVTETRPGSYFNSKFSGLPLLSVEESWPQCGQCDQLMQLLVQLNAHELPQQPFGLGLLQVFYCTACDNYEPFSKSSLVRIVDPVHTPAQQLVFSPVNHAFPEKVITDWTLDTDYPSGQEAIEIGCNLTEEDEARYEDFPLQGDKLLGWPAWVQGIEYPECPECKREMDYLFQIDSDDHLDFMFGDSGCSHVSQCPTHPRQLAITWACC